MQSNHDLHIYAAHLAPQLDPTRLKPGSFAAPSDCNYVDLSRADTPGEVNSSNRGCGRLRCLLILSEQRQQASNSSCAMDGSRSNDIALSCAVRIVKAPYVVSSNTVSEPGRTGRPPSCDRGNRSQSFQRWIRATEQPIFGGRAVCDARRGAEAPAANEAR
jgi:hypothetical protein